MKEKSVKAKFLIVDDYDLARGVIRGCLEHMGYDPDLIQEASSEKEAINKLYEEEYDIVITDLDLQPSGSGLTVLLVAKKIKPNIPVILVSGISSKEFENMGFDAAFRKPFKTQDFIATISRLHKI